MPDINDESAAKESGFDSSKCPLPNTHQRLRQAHMLWHQASESYHEPERFLTNINSLIQELRNITFILQSEKHCFLDFDAWYAPFQARLKADKDAKWLVDNRNLVVKQGALQGASFARIRLVTYREKAIATIKIPAALSSQSVIEGDDFGKLLPEMRSLVTPEDDAVVAIEKMWSTPELPDRELLDVLAGLYSSLADMVLSAHITLGSLACTSRYDDDSPLQHRDFRLLYDRAERLRCMSDQVNDRTSFFRLNDLAQMIPATVQKTVSLTAADVFARYGFNEFQAMPAFEELDASAFAEKVVFTSKKVLRRDRNLARIIWLRDGTGQWRQQMIIAANRAEKYLMMQRMASVVRETGCDAVIEVGEVWTADASAFPNRPNPVLENYAGRGEAISVMLATREGLVRRFSTPFRRGVAGGIKLSDTVESDSFHAFDLEPIIKVWGVQRRPAKDSVWRISVWEPDALDSCPCGADKPFGTCCKDQLAAIGKRDGHDVKTFIAEGNIPEAEKLARAIIARYAIWVRQQTASWLHGDRKRARQIIPIDASAIEAQVGWLETTALASGNIDSVLFTYRRLQEILGVPALARRMVALAARWLIRNGRTEEGLLELDLLGKIERSKDWLALTIAAQHGGHDPNLEITLLKESVDSALGPDERSIAYRNLAYCYYGVQRRDDSLATIRVFNAMEGADPDVARTLVILKWMNTSEAQDFDEAFAIMKSEEDQEQICRWGALLMDRNLPDSALELMRSLVGKNHLFAMIFSIECYLRRGDKQTAYDIFQCLRPESLTDLESQCGYAHVQTLMVFLGGREELRSKSIEDLKSVISAGAPQEQMFTEMLAGLQSSHA
jgi:hypothetical protein